MRAFVHQAGQVGNNADYLALTSLLQTCKVNGIDGYRYLRALFVALPNAKTVDDYAALLPWRIELGKS